MFCFFWRWGMWDLSSSTRDWTHISCFGRRSLNHGTTREVPLVAFGKEIYLQPAFFLGTSSQAWPLFLLLEYLKGRRGTFGDGKLKRRWPCLGSASPRRAWHLPSLLGQIWWCPLVATSRAMLLLIFNITFKSPPWIFPSPWEFWDTSPQRRQTFSTFLTQRSTMKDEREKVTVKPDRLINVATIFFSFTHHLLMKGVLWAGL